MESYKWIRTVEGVEEIFLRSANKNGSIQPQYRINFVSKIQITHEHFSTALKHLYM